MVKRAASREEQAPPTGSAAPSAYSALPVRLAPGSAQSRYLFIRQHRVERGAADDGTAERTLFVAALPSWCGAAVGHRCCVHSLALTRNESSLRQLRRERGPRTHVDFR